MIADIEEYFAKGCGRCERFATPDCSAARWSAGLQQLRVICRAEELEETLRWGHPCYRRAGRNIAIIGAFRDDFRLSFFNAALMQDPHSVLERQGPNTKHKDMIRFTSRQQVSDCEVTVRAYLREAASYAAQGLQPPKDDSDLAWPDELAEALAEDPELAQAFGALTPGRRRSYVIHLSAAKQSATRAARIRKLREKILAGKGATER